MNIFLLLMRCWRDLSSDHSVMVFIPDVLLCDWISQMLPAFKVFSQKVTNHRTLFQFFFNFIFF